MNSTTNETHYIINNVQQLFELNKSLTNFSSRFSVQSITNEPFYGIITNQKNLDSGNKLEYKFAETGIFSGEIVQDNNINDHWYLVLKSPSPNKVTIDIDTKPVNPKIQPQSQSQPNQPQQQIYPQTQHSQKKSKHPWFKILLIAVIVGIGIYFILKLFVFKDNKISTLNVGSYGGSGGSSSGSAGNIGNIGSIGGGNISNESMNMEDVLGDDIVNQINNLPSF